MYPLHYYLLIDRNRRQITEWIGGEETLLYHLDVTVENLGEKLSKCTFLRNQFLQRSLSPGLASISARRN